MTGPQLIKSPLRFAPVGQCIYCGKDDELSDEHIIPYALGGTLILPESSCAACAEVTSQFERRVLRGFMYRARVAGRFPTRRPKDRPPKLGVEILRGLAPESVEVASAAAPVLLQLPMLAEAAFITDRRKTTGVEVVGTETLLFGAAPGPFLAQSGATTLRQTDNQDVTSYARMLAKIAYGYLVATQGLCERSQVPVLPLILGQADNASEWLGSGTYTTESEALGAAHVLALIDGSVPTECGPERVTLARVKLFASAGATGYEIVVRRGF